MNEKANYGNWVPEKALYTLFGAVIVLGVTGGSSTSSFK